MNRRIWLLLVAAVVIAAFALHGCGGPKPLVVKFDTVYQLISTGKVITLKQGDVPPIKCMLMTFAYVNGDINDRGTIPVPIFALKRDPTLDMNRIVWDTPVTLEGITYSNVRWNARLMPALELPSVTEKEPLREK